MDIQEMDLKDDKMHFIIPNYPYDDYYGYIIRSKIIPLEPIREYPPKIYSGMLFVNVSKIGSYSIELFSNLSLNYTFNFSIRVLQYAHAFIDIDDQFIISKRGGTKTIDLYINSTSNVKLNQSMIYIDSGKLKPYGFNFEPDFDNDTVGPFFDPANHTVHLSFNVTFPNDREYIVTAQVSGK